MDSPVRALIADDNIAYRTMLTAAAQGLGFEVEIVSDGQAAIEAFARRQAGVVLLDIAMPRADGFRAARAIRASAGGDEAVIVAVTAHAGEYDHARFTEAGFDAVVGKPFLLDALVEALRQSGGLAPAEGAVQPSGQSAGAHTA